MDRNHKPPNEEDHTSTKSDADLAGITMCSTLEVEGDDEVRTHDGGEREQGQQQHLQQDGGSKRRSWRTPARWEDVDMDMDQMIVGFPQTPEQHHV